MNTSVRGATSNKASGGQSAIKHGALLVLEEKLVREVDEEFFQDPKSFRTLNRVIDVLGSQLLDRRRVISSTEGELRSNPTYLALKKQQGIVDDAIEYIAVKHCADLNQSVVAVGKVSRELGNAVDQVRNLRTQVKEIKASLGTTGVANSNNPSMDNHQHHSLRELWLKKLECEAVLSLLNKLKILREAPASFDQLIHPKSGYPCRVAAAVMLLRNAIDTMFNDDVAQIQALTKLSEQLMQRKQRAEEIVWDALHDVLYLRTAVSSKVQDIDYDVNDDGASSVASEDEEDSSTIRSFTTLNYNGNHPYRMIPLTVLKEELHLEQKELQCLEEPTASNQNAYSYEISSSSSKGPKYTDATSACHILVEALAGLGRLDDVERYLSESLPIEIRRVAEMVQGRTFAQLEKTRIRRLRNRQSGQGQGESPLRLHLKNLLSAFEQVMLRIAHLSQIMRHRISSNPQVLTPSYETASSALHSVIVSADSLMQKEIKEFLKACLYPSDATTSGKGNTSSSILGAFDASRDMPSNNREIFSLGIISEYPGAGPQQKPDSYGYSDTFNAKLRLSAANIMELPTEQFVTSVLLVRAGSEPQVRHALMFRSALARWSNDVSDLKRELAVITGQDKDTSTRSNSLIAEEQSSLQFLDIVIQKKLLPLLQEEAVYSTTSSLERDDAFLPVFRNNIYLRSAEGEQPLCLACQVLLDATRPLFSALHRLPKGGDSYLSLVAVLDHALLAFVSRAKQRARTICAGKAADELLGEVGNSRSKSGLSVAVEHRRAFSMLMIEYSNSPGGEEEHVANMVAKGTGILPLAPPHTDTKAKSAAREKSSSSQSSQFSVGDQRLEESTLQQELTHLQLLLRYQGHNYGDALTVCNDDELMNASCLGHSLLKLANLLEKRIRCKAITADKTDGATRQLREAISSIRTHGQRMAKFCRIDALVHTVKHMCKICKTYSLQTSEAARIPPCVNDVGEYLTNASDLIREAGGNTIAAYSFSSLEQYIPLLLMESVRQIGKNDSRLTKSVISLKGVESLDRSGSVLYRDLKNATSFDGSFWDDAAATDSFERAASFISLLELDMEELESYCIRNRNEFSDSDYSLMFSINCPNRSGDVRKFYDLKARLNSEGK